MINNISLILAVEVPIEEPDFIAPHPPARLSDFGGVCRCARF